MRTWKIYGLVDPRTETVKYVGCTSMQYVSNRLSAHLSHARSTAGRNGLRRDRKTMWVRELLAADLRPGTVILQTAFSAEEAAEVEAQWIVRLGAQLTNEAAGGPGLPQPSDRVRQGQRVRMERQWENLTPEEQAAAAKRLDDASHTPKANAKRAAKWVGRRHTPEARARMAEAHQGRTASPETKAKMAESQRRRQAEKRAARLE